MENKYTLILVVQKLYTNIYNEILKKKHDSLHMAKGEMIKDFIYFVCIYYIVHILTNYDYPSCGIVQSVL